MSLRWPALRGRPFFRALPAACKLRVEETRLSDLTKRKCKPCEGGVEPLSREAADAYIRELHHGWYLSADGTTIQRDFTFPAYSRTVAFANAVVWIATNEGHHPEMTVNYGSCRVAYTTNAIDGLSENDFICAAKVDQLLDEA
jgi:4a-hydroxytetrahydrobiopterin dehydratase